MNPRGARTLTEGKPQGLNLFTGLSFSSTEAFPEPLCLATEAPPLGVFKSLALLKVLFVFVFSFCKSLQIAPNCNQLFFLYFSKSAIFQTFPPSENRRPSCTPTSWLGGRRWVGEGTVLGHKRAVVFRACGMLGNHTHFWFRPRLNSGRIPVKIFIHDTASSHHCQG